MTADEVDRIVAGWQAVRPDLDVAPLEVLSRVKRLARHLDLARREAFSANGLEAFEFDVLSALRRSGEPYVLSPGQLQTQTMVSSGTMTNRIDRMIDHGLVSREPATDDRRGVRVKLTGTGRDKVDVTLSELLVREESILADIRPQQRAQLAKLLRDLLLPLDSPPSIA